MTERSLSISTQSATSIKPIFTTTSAAIPTNDVQFVTEPVDDEPYTIRCICNICEDDGNTIYCDKCETWQHIECYYAGSVEDASREDFDHLCVDCFPRDLGRHAIEKQQYRQNKVNYDNNDKKIKRPATKSHKKKTKPSEIQTNGFNDQETHKNAGSLDNHTHKRAKGHRSQHSVSSQATKRSPTYAARSNNHPPSPNHTTSNLPNDFHIHGYSKVFQSLYDDQLPETNDNTLANLSVTNKLAMWKTDAKQFEEDVGKKFDDVVQKTKVRLDPQQFPKLHVDVKTALINNNAKAQWKSLYTTTKTPGNQPIGEINGKIGLQSDYHKNPDNGWEECPHPRPLTFFIPGLPLYIDTRAGGSQCRYIRRSCRANANLETYIVANTSEYHFYLTLDSALSPDEQITLPWDFKFVDKPRLDRALHLDGDDDDRLPDISETEYQSMAHSINLVLSDHGGCACNAGKDCAFVRFHRDYYGRVHGQPQPQSNGVNGVKSKKGRKPRQHVSPTSTGHATNSRAASEGHPEANDDDDTRSTSGSGRSKPHSRDLTPIHGLGEFDTPSTEPSDREKRKLVAVENTFRKMEQAPPRKKKRASDGSSMNSPVTTTSQTNSKPRQKSVVSRTSVSQSALTNFNGSRSRQYVDASTSRRQSASPPSAASPQAMASPKPIPSRDDSATPRSRHNSVVQKMVFVYTDSSAQTDRDEGAWYEQRTKPNPKKPVLSLARRMLLKHHKIHEQAQALAAEQNKNMAAGLINGDLQNISSPASAMDVDGPVQEDRSITQSPTDTRARNGSIVSSTPSVDVISNPGDYHTDGSTLTTGQTMKPPSWPGHSTNGYSHKSPELRVQMPPTPTFITPNLSGTPGALTPASAATSSAMSPYGTTHFSSYSTTLANGVNPSPAKKKMSLNDYKARKKQNADGSGGRKPSTGSSPTMPSAVLKSTLSTIEEAKAREILLDSKSEIIEGKEIVDPSPIDLLKVSPPKNNMPSQHSNGAL